jgi:hypothetical protein
MDDDGVSLKVSLFSFYQLQFNPRDPFGNALQLGTIDDGGVDRAQSGSDASKHQKLPGSKSIQMLVVT